MDGAGTFHVCTCRLPSTEFFKEYRYVRANDHGVTRLSRNLHVSHRIVRSLCPFLLSIRQRFPLVMEDVIVECITTATYYKLSSRHVRIRTLELQPRPRASCSLDPLDSLLRIRCLARRGDMPSPIPRIINLRSVNEAFSRFNTKRSQSSDDA